MAERVGFEPTNPVRGLRFSSLTTRATTARRRAYLPCCRAILVIAFCRESPVKRALCHWHATWKFLITACLEGSPDVPRRPASTRADPRRPAPTRRERLYLNGRRKPYPQPFGTRTADLIIRIYVYTVFKCESPSTQGKMSGTWRCAASRSTSRANSNGRPRCLWKMFGATTASGDFRRSVALAGGYICWYLRHAPERSM